MVDDERLRRWAGQYTARLGKRALALDSYIELSVAPRKASGGFSEQPSPTGATEERNDGRIPVSRLLQEGAPKQCLLVGPPGCGKSTVCLFLAQRILRRFLEGEANEIAVLLHGRAITREADDLFVPIISNIDNLDQTDVPESIRAVAQAGRMTLILDGFDESPRSTYSSQARLVEEWAARNPDSRCIVTCRSFYDPVLPGFQVYDFVPLTESDVDRFVRLRLPRHEAERFLDAARRSVTQSVLLSSPLLLSLLIETYHRTGVLPDPASFTFTNLVNGMFQESIDPNMRIAMTAVLAQLAKRMKSSGTLVATREMLKDVIHSNRHLLGAWSNSDGVMTSLLKTGFLLEESSSGALFMHASLLDHFAGSDLGPIDQVWKPPLIVPPSTIEVVRFVDQELLKRLAKEPRELYRLSPRDFEKVIAELFRDKGWTVELTKQTRDGGSDIIAVRSDVGSRLQILIEAKRYGPEKTIGVGIVRQLYAVRQMRHASKAILATTSHFSPDVFREFSSVMPWELELSDYDEILKWLRSYGGAGN